MADSMGSEQENEKLFTEKVDRLLSGEEDQIDGIRDADLRSALEFAGKMAALRPGPSPQFESRLRERLLRQLAEQEEKSQRAEKPGWTRWFALHKPVWQAATAVVVVVVIIGVSWAVGVFDDEPPPVVSVPSATEPGGTVPPMTTMVAAPAASTPAPTVMATTQPAATAPASPRPPLTTTAVPLPAGILAADASTDKTVYRPGEEVKIEVTLRNYGQSEINIERFPPILSLMDEADRQPVYTFHAGNDGRTIGPYSTISYTATWSQVDFDGQQVPGGRYYIELEDLDYQGYSVQLTLPRQVSFDIVPHTY